jgi:hypothetical protein
MLAATGSTITAARSSPNRSNASSAESVELYAVTMVSRRVPSVTPGESGSPSVAAPDPAETSRASTCPW